VTARITRPPAVLGVLALAAVLVTASACAASDSGSAERFPAFELEDLRDASRTVSSSDLRGKPAVVNLFASWCAPCKRELPVLVAAAARYGDRVRFLGIDHQDSRNEGIELLDRFQVTYPAAYDPRGTVRAKLPQTGLPVTVFVTAAGEISSLKLGEIGESDLERRIAQLLG
jgi:cytochrome c biogenesis protein CcmG, thiol:disulfide interchange protein DsbE